MRKARALVPFTVFSEFAATNDLVYFSDRSITLDEARRRREEGAKHRTRRASVMGLLEAEKLKDRKLSTPSIQGSSGW